MLQLPLKEDWPRLAGQLLQRRLEIGPCCLTLTSMIPEGHSVQMHLDLAPAGLHSPGTMMPLWHDLCLETGCWVARHPDVYQQRQMAMLLRSVYIHR